MYIQPEVESFGFHREPDSLGFLDTDGFNRLEFVLSEDTMSSESIVTVLFGGYPVLIVRSEDFLVPLIPDTAVEQAYAWLLEMIGEASEGATELVAERGMDALFESGLVGEGRVLADFADVIWNEVESLQREDA